MEPGKRPPGVMLYFAEMRPIFVLLSAEERGELLLKVFDYAEFGIEPVLSGRLVAVWPLVQRMIDRDAEAYQKKCERAKRAAQNRWEREHGTAQPQADGAQGACDSAVVSAQPQA